jgi:hypothetical protein
MCKSFFWWIRRRGSVSFPWFAFYWSAFSIDHSFCSWIDLLCCLRFVPPENFNLAVLTLELDFIKRAGSRNEQVFNVWLQQVDFVVINLLLIRVVWTLELKLLMLLCLVDWCYCTCQATSEEVYKAGKVFHRASCAL